MQLLDQFCHKPGPARLVAGNKIRVLITMEILIQQAVLVCTEPITHYADEPQKGNTGERRQVQRQHHDTGSRPEL